MLTTSLINLAVLAYFSVSSGHDMGFGLYDERPNLRQYLSEGYRNENDWSFRTRSFHAGNSVVAKAEEKVVLRVSPLSEKYGLGLETVTHPDQEIVVLRSSARGVKSALALGERIAKQTSEKAPFTSQWKDRFVLIWDGDKGIYFDGTYIPGYADRPEQIKWGSTKVDLAYVHPSQ